MKHKTSLSSFTLVGGIVLCALPFSATAAALSFLNNTIVADIPASDVPALRSRISEVLGTVADGTTTDWTSTPHGSRAPVRMALTPVQSVQTRTAASCRLLDARVSQAKGTEHWRFWFCKQGDGVWKASGSGMPR